MRALPVAVLVFLAALPAAAKERQPDGNGDPAATTCMEGEKPTGSQLPLRICYTNAQWATLKARWIAILPNGRPALALDAPPGTTVMGPDGQPLLSVNDPRNIRSQECTRQYTGGVSSSLSPNFNVICDSSQ